MLKGRLRMPAVERMAVVWIFGGMAHIEFARRTGLVILAILDFTSGSRLMPSKIALGSTRTRPQYGPSDDDHPVILQ